LRQISGILSAAEIKGRLGRLADDRSDVPDDFEGDTAVTHILPDVPYVSGPWQGTLTVLRGSNTGAYFALNAQGTLIGRSEQAHVTLVDEGASRSHARILCKDGHYELEDLGSTNGSFIDGQRVGGRVALIDGARIQIGNTLLRFSLQDQIELDASRRVYDASVRDSLTGMLNRRYFEERMAGEFCYAARHGSALSVLLIDVDHFKRINDSHGHQAGDEVLREVANQLRAAVRAEDVAARYGGEEFAVLARGIDVSAARVLAERLRTCVERASIQWRDKRLSVTVSVGFAHNHAGSAVSKPDQLLAAADQALYAAKSGGRNRIDLARSPSRYSMRSSEPPPEVDPGRRRAWDQVTAPTGDTATHSRPPPGFRPK
jgi:two-component system cell cycle response regulator